MAQAPHEVGGSRPPNSADAAQLREIEVQPAVERLDDRAEDFVWREELPQVSALSFLENSLDLDQCLRRRELGQDLGEIRTRPLGFVLSRGCHRDGAGLDYPEPAAVETPFDVLWGGVVLLDLDEERPEPANLVKGERS